MPEQLSDEELYRHARRRVAARKGFFVHLSVYIIVNALLVVIWATTGAQYPWFIFPLAGWGIGLLFHCLGVFVFSGNTAWEQREIEKEVERMRRINR